MAMLMIAMMMMMMATSTSAESAVDRTLLASSFFSFRSSIGFGSAAEPGEEEGRRGGRRKGLHASRAKPRPLSPQHEHEH